MAYRRIGIQILAITLLFLVTAPVPVYSASFPGGPIVPCGGAVEGTTPAGTTLPPCTVCHIAQVAQNVLNTGIYIAVFLSGFLFVWAGLLYLTNVTNPNGVTKAKTLFVDALLGLLIVLGAWLVIDTLMKTLTPDANGKFGPWNEICKK
ncbi:MAG: hypothetical protein A2787_04955 [Omnitrophica WOR_2 bacterium RIFCSPHIGHO2_01_FULL_48_9]|nr:MAG: hypothetical protein A2787_04955 [Omnitrophica WOR_2 bacterium RIFCSPHIGHO2_01_FULL_48_9]